MQTYSYFSHRELCAVNAALSISHCARENHSWMLLCLFVAFRAKWETESNMAGLIFNLRRCVNHCLLWQSHVGSDGQRLWRGGTGDGRKMIACIKPAWSAADSFVPQMCGWGRRGSGESGETTTTKTCILWLKQKHEQINMIVWLITNIYALRSEIIVWMSAETQEVLLSHTASPDLRHWRRRRWWEPPWLALWLCTSTMTASTTRGYGSAQRPLLSCEWDSDFTAQFPSLFCRMVSILHVG